MRLSLTLLALVAGCDGSTSPSTCAQARCDGATEFCVLQISDIAGEPDVATCEALPSTCTGSASCACVEAGDDETSFNLEFCIGLGGCDVVGGTVEVICPGG